MSTRPGARVGSAVLLAFALTMSACHSSIPSGIADGTIADHLKARESVLRSIPSEYIDRARESFHIAYQHTSHGTHVSYGVFGLAGYKPGDGVRFGVSPDGDAGTLEFRDYAIAPGEYCDLSTSDNAGWASWLTRNRTYLDDPANAAVNAVLWSWCDITGHDVEGYLESMQTLIGEYGPGGSKIGTGSGKRPTPVAFIFMTGHAYTNNEGSRLPRDQARLIVEYCEDRGYYCLDYYSIDSHDMAGNYWRDASDDAASGLYEAEIGSDTGNFYADWQDAHTEGTAWYYNQSSPGGSSTTDFGEHLSQHVTANRKAYALWWILARMAGWGE